MSNNKTSLVEAIAAFVIVCMILVGLYASKTTEDHAQREINNVITLDASN